MVNNVIELPWDYECAHKLGALCLSWDIVKLEIIYWLVTTNEDQVPHQYGNIY